MTAPTRSDNDKAVLATVATALLIRYGGQALFSAEEWQQAIDHESTMLVTKEDGPVMVALLPVKEARA